MSKTTGGVKSYNIISSLRSIFKAAFSPCVCLGLGLFKRALVEGLEPLHSSCLSGKLAEAAKNSRAPGSAKKQYSADKNYPVNVSTSASVEGFDVVVL
jgi:hypothetical protein